MTPRTPNPADPAELRRSAVVARHHGMRDTAAALEGAAERIEGLERIVAAYLRESGTLSNPCKCPICIDAREALNPSTKKAPC